ncbi:MAG: hypothetical protein IJD81_06535 [Oscillospiraceae bacterium]|nr:hypothetical protein [Oscillospiraceae bacterium]
MNKKMIAPVVVAVLLVLYFVGYAVLLLAIPDLHLIVKLLALIPLIMAGYALWAAKERIEEIKGGEEDDLSQY